MSLVALLSFTSLGPMLERVLLAAFRCVNSSALAFFVSIPDRSGVWDLRRGSSSLGLRDTIWGLSLFFDQRSHSRPARSHSASSSRIAAFSRSFFVPIGVRLSAPFSR